jgi:hypothetical protein
MRNECVVFGKTSGEKFLIESDTKYSVKIVKLENRTLIPNYDAEKCSVNLAMQQSKVDELGKGYVNSKCSSCGCDTEVVVFKRK